LDELRTNGTFKQKQRELKLTSFGVLEYNSSYREKYSQKAAHSGG
jgi:hypothetical protein